MSRRDRAVPFMIAASLLVVLGAGAWLIWALPGVGQAAKPRWSVQASRSTPYPACKAAMEGEAEPFTDVLSPPAGAISEQEAITIADTYMTANQDISASQGYIPEVALMNSTFPDDVQRLAWGVVYIGAYDSTGLNAEITVLYVDARNRDLLMVVNGASVKEPYINCTTNYNYNQYTDLTSAAILIATVFGCIGVTAVVAIVAAIIIRGGRSTEKQ